MPCIEVTKDDGINIKNAHPLVAYDLYMERDRVGALEACAPDVEKMLELDEKSGGGCEN